MRIGFEAEWLAGHVLENFAGHPLALAVVSKIRLIMKLVSKAQVSRSRATRTSWPSWPRTRRTSAS
jgi:hypothetical protein